MPNPRGNPPIIMPTPKLGVIRAQSREEQPEGSLVSANNVVPYDPYSGFLKLTQRLGTQPAATLLGNATGNPIQGLLPIGYIVQAGSPILPPSTIVFPHGWIHSTTFYSTTVISTGPTSFSWNVAPSSQVVIQATCSLNAPSTLFDAAIFYARDVTPEVTFSFNLNGTGDVAKATFGFDVWYLASQTPALSTGVYGIEMVSQTPLTGSTGTAFIFATGGPGTGGLLIGSTALDDVTGPPLTASAEFTAVFSWAAGQAEAYQLQMYVNGNQIAQTQVATSNYIGPLGSLQVSTTPYPQLTSAVGFSTMYDNVGQWGFTIT
jgi:hypothetical protein